MVYYVDNGNTRWVSGRNELSVYRGRDKMPEKGAVVLESFSSAGGENLLRIKLLSSGKWKVVHSAYADNRLIQLFVPDETAHPIASLMPETMKMMGFFSVLNSANIFFKSAICSSEAR